jgi:ATP-dependent RNA helicase DHX36
MGGAAGGVEAAAKGGAADRLKLYPLHGGMATREQRGIFEPPPPVRRKVVIATNIAESSITIDDVVYVIDTGKHKEKTYDAENNIGCLLPTWVSRTSAHQRRGRAGQVQPGHCFHLFPLKAKLAEYQFPEILRTPLEQLCLQVRALELAPTGTGGIECFLQRALSPPSARTLANALHVLHQTGALHRRTEALTALGRQLAALPVDPRIGKALIHGCLLGCIEPVLTIVSLLSHRNPFVMPQPAQEARGRPG